MRRGGHGGAGASERNVEGSVIGRNGAGACGGDDGRFGLLEEPFDGFAIGLVA